MSDSESDEYTRSRRNHRRAAAWWVNAAMKFSRGRDKNKLKLDREETGAEYITRQLNGHPLVVRDQYRLSPALFQRLCDELKAGGLACDGDLIIQEHVGMFLQMVGQGATIRKLSIDFQHSEETVSRSLKTVLRSVLWMVPNYMKLPRADAPIHPKLGEGTVFNPFKGALGAIDGTHIRAFPDCNKPSKERWRNSKGIMSQNVMAAVDFDGRFLGVVTGWEGSAHDSLVLRTALENGFTVPEGRYYLVDGGYANTHQFLSPYRHKKHRLANFQRRKDKTQYGNAEELFNHRHAQLRNIVERTFGILKGRFKICREMHNYKYEFQTKVVIACCVLHNFIKHHQILQDDIGDDSDGDLGDNDDDDDDDGGNGGGGVPSTSGKDDDMDIDVSMANCTDAQRGGALRDRIRDLLWNNEN